MHLVNAIPAYDPKMQIVLCAGAPDTPEIGREMEHGVARAAAQRQAVICCIFRLSYRGPIPDRLR